MPNTQPDPVKAAAGRLGAYRSRPTPPEKIDAARRAVTEAVLAKHIADALAAAPPLTDEQRGRLAALLRGGAQ